MGEEQQKEAEFEVGDRVAWNYGAGKARGHVVEKLTEDRKLGARKFKASPEEPKYLLKIDKTGKEAIRKGETLQKIEEDENAVAKQQGGKKSLATEEEEEEEEEDEEKI